MRRGTALHATAAEHGTTRTVTRDRDLSALALIVFVAAIVFLPSALQLTYFRDDWYYMLDGTSAGAGVFPAMFSSDRPARGIVFAWLFTAFGADPLPYQHPGLGAAGRNEPDRLQHHLRIEPPFPCGRRKSDGSRQPAVREGQSPHGRMPRPT
jgi:hypothetical protein